MASIQKIILLNGLLLPAVHSSESKILDELANLNTQLSSLQKIVKPTISASSEKDDPFLEELEKFAQDFPKDQNRFLTKNEALKKIMKKIGEVASHFDAEITHFYPSGNDRGIKKYTFTFSKKNTSHLPFRASRIWFKGESSHGDPLSNDKVSQKIKSILSKKDKIAPKDVRDYLSTIKTWTSEYKIHLMPFKPDIPLVLYKLIKAIKKNANLLEAVYDFKFMVIMPSLETGLTNIPTIVIYAAAGKENAQLILNEVYKVFGDMAGLGITPRFNAEITSLIYFAQGGGDLKTDKYYSYLFEKGDNLGNGRVYYRPDLTGEYVDYHLKNPKTGERT